MSEEITGTADGIAAGGSGHPASFVLYGLRDVEGTFKGKLDADAMVAFAGNSGAQPMEVYISGPVRNLPWYWHWFYRIRERVRGTPYPTEIYGHGPATFDIESDVEGEEETVISGRFTVAGKWTFDE